MSCRSNLPNCCLTVCQLKFAQNYITGMSGKDAALKAGYSVKAAKQISYRLLNNQKIQEYIAKLRSQLEDKYLDSYAWKIGKLRKIVELNCPDSATNAGDIDPDPTIKGINELNKMEGHHMETKKPSVDVNITIELNKIKELTEKAIEKLNYQY